MVPGVSVRPGRAQSQDSGFLGPRGQDHRGGQTVHTKSRDVDLITAVRGKLGEDTDRGGNRLLNKNMVTLSNPSWDQQDVL